MSKKKSILVIGLGKFGKHISETFIENGHEVMGIDINEDRADNAVDIIQNILIDDARDEKFMKTLGINNFDLAVIAIGDNFQSVLEITVILKDLNCKFIVARANSEIHKKLLLRNGADHVVYAEKEIAERLAIKFGADNIFDFIELTPEIGIYEISVPKIWIGKTIIDLAIRNKYNISIIATKKNRKIKPIPNPEHMFTEDETLIIMGENDDIEKVTKLEY